MSKESDAIKPEAKILGRISLAYFVCAIYLALTSFAMHGTIEEIEKGAFCFAISGFVAMFCTIAYLTIDKLKREKEETDT